MWYYDGRIRIKPDWNVNDNIDDWLDQFEMYQNKTRLECKLKAVMERVEGKLDQNKTRLECKFHTVLAICKRRVYQNKTRLECKFLSQFSFTPCTMIRIKPDWNVNKVKQSIQKILKKHQNKTRLECK